MSYVSVTKTWVCLSNTNAIISSSEKITEESKEQYGELRTGWLLYVNFILKGIRKMVGNSLDKKGWGKWRAE